MEEQAITIDINAEESSKIDDIANLTNFTCESPFSPTIPGSPTCQSPFVPTIPGSPTSLQTPIEERKNEEPTEVDLSRQEINNDSKKKIEKKKTFKDKVDVSIFNAQISNDFNF